MAESFDSAKLDTLSGDEQIVAEAIMRFNRCAEFEAIARERFMEDLKFAHADSENGFQWPNNLLRARATEQKPCLTMNMVRQHNLNIVNEAKRNKSSVKFVGMGNGATQESANVLQQIARHIEYQSNAQAAYETAREFQVDAGKGWVRLVTDWAGPDSFDQEIYVRRVPDPLSVYCDPDCIEKDKSDATFLFAFDVLSMEEYKQHYPQFQDVGTLQPLGVAATDSFWTIKDHVRVVEYFRKVPKRDRLISFVPEGSRQRREIRESRLHESMRKEILDSPNAKIREIEELEVEWYLIAAETIIDRTTWVGKYIPFACCVGEEGVIEGMYDCKGHTRYLKDSQRMFNYNAALALDTKIPTPTGWTTMGQLQEGDWIFDHNGSPVQVAKVLPVKQNESCFRVKFDNGYSVVTDAGHIWQVEERGKRKSSGDTWTNETRATAELRTGNHFVKCTLPLSIADAQFAIDPYVLGTWLGDGHSIDGRIYAHEDDVCEQRSIFAGLGYYTSEPSRNGGKGVVFNTPGLMSKLKEINVLGEKHVPLNYLRGSFEQRLALLQGLMDTDGHYAKAVNQCVFVNGNQDIARAVLELCASLGIKATVLKQPEYAKEGPKGQTYISKPTYRIQFTADSDLPVFRLERKRVAQMSERKTHWRRTKRLEIVSVERVESVPVRCITLDTAEHLYLCSEGMIPTHNSASVEFGALQTKTPWIVPAKAIEEFETMWNAANRVNYSALPYNHIDDEGQPIPPPQRVEPPKAAPVFESGMMNARAQMMEVSGQYQNALGEQGNERTGKAINSRIEQSATSVYHFYDNYAQMLRFVGKQIIDLVGKVYDTKRVKRIMADDGTEMDVELDPSARQAYFEVLGHQGEVIRRVFNPALGRYDVAAEVGAAYGTRRQETLEALTLILTQAPALTGILGDLLVGSMDFDKALEAAQRMKRLVPPAALGKGPSPQEKAMATQIQQLQGLLAKTLNEKAKDQLKLVGKGEMRDIDAYDAETKRMAALQKMLPMDQEGLKEVISQLVEQSLQTTLSPVLDANREAIASAAGTVPEEQPPMTGAKKAPDGQWYILDPTRKGKYLRVGPLAQER